MENKPTYKIGAHKKGAQAKAPGLMTPIKINLHKPDQLLPDFTIDLTHRMAGKIQDSRDEILKNRLESLGINIDFDKEEKSRFKSLIREFKGNEETIYYNNGSVGGLRVVTFATILKPINPETMTIEAEITFY